ncbi:MAG: PfkB family carbohydrate kinase [Chloroflexota bacterium]|jgi:sugar/nucleoside kinase (ribokinase family)|nr:PfkB family carbohydrate kinase [Chloroflexota bacterium]MDH5242794.1 PfkB family carbohydrate kinase [Chloroflexota bacterium]
MSPASIDVVHVGSASRDVASDDIRGWRLGGGVTYAALTTARLGLRTAAVVGADQAAAQAHELDGLRSAGVDLLIVPLREGPVFHNVETPGGRRQTAVSVGDSLDPVLVPESWLRARGWSFTPVAGEIGDDWLAVVGDSALVAVGWQGMLRQLRPGRPVGLLAPSERKLIRRADIVGVSQQDVDDETSVATLTGHLHDGARLLVTQGHRGGLLVSVGADGPTGSLRYLPTETESEVDPTGAGDTFLAALVAVTLRPSLAGLLRRRLGADLRFAAAAGSLAVERVGLSGVPDLASVRTRAVRERVRRFVMSEGTQVRTDPPPS